MKDKVKDNRDFLSSGEKYVLRFNYYDIFCEGISEFKVYLSDYGFLKGEKGNMDYHFLPQLNAIVIDFYENSPDTSDLLGKIRALPGSELEKACGYRAL